MSSYNYELQATLRDLNYVIQMRARLRDFKYRFVPTNLANHPYPEQFTQEFDCPNVGWADRFVMIASTGRCGSHYLGHMLMMTEECGVPLEYLNRGNARYWRARFGNLNFQEIFAKLVEQRTSQNGTFCFKAHWWHYVPFRNKMDTMTRGQGLDKIVWISRRNQLAQAISKVIAQQTGAWISGVTPKHDATYSYTAIVRAAKINWHGNMRWRSHLAERYHDRYKAVAYEDLLSSAQTRTELADFIGIQQELEPSERTQRQKDDKKSEWRERFLNEMKDEDRWIVEVPKWFEAEM